MGERNMSINQMNNLEHDQQARFHIHSELCAVSGSASNYPQPSMNHMLPVLEPVTGFVPHHLSGGNSENPISYGTTRYNVVHQHPLAGNMGPATTSDCYNLHMTPSGSSVFPPEINQVPQSVDGLGGAYKRKSTEWYLGNHQYHNSVAGPSSVVGPSSMVPLTTEVGSQWSVRPGSSSVVGPSSMVSLLMEVGSQRSVRPGPVGGETVLAHNPNHLIQGNYQGQASIPANAPWLDQRFSSNGGDGGTWALSQGPSMLYIHGSGVNGGGTTGERNMVPEPYQETAVPRSLTTLQPCPPLVLYPMERHPQFFPNLIQPVQRTFYSQVPGPSYGPPRNSPSHTNVNPFQVSMEVGPAYVGPVPHIGLGVYHPYHGRSLVPGVSMRHHTHPQLSILPADEVAMLEIPGYYEMGNAADQHRDMRMDVDSMSYEELLALEEHMGYVGTGLSENTISGHLETRTHVSLTTSTEFHDRDTNFCTICQTNYENQEKIGRLDCGHEYHVDCVKRWLVLKNICPICKSSALTTKSKDLAREG